MDIYQYEDFRLFLKDCFEERRKIQSKYTHRKLAQEAGVANPGYFNDVIKNRRTLSAVTREKMIRVFDLKTNEADYFRLLVEYGQCKKIARKQEYYQQMLFRRNRSIFVRLNPAGSRYYQDYHYPLIRVAIEALGFRGDYEQLARFLRPSIPVATVKKCVRDLCEWGLVKQEADGKYTVTNTFQEPAPNMGDVIKRLNREWIMHGANALDIFPKAERHISSRLLAVSQEANQEMERALERFRAEIYEIVKCDKHPDRVIQLNIQYFPRTAVRGKK